MFNFDFSDAEDVKSSTLPKGKYHVAITNAEVKDSKTGNPMLKLEFTVQDGEYDGRKLWKSFMLKHDNKKVVDIAKSQIKSMCLAAGKEPRFSSPSDLLGFEMEVTTKVTTNDFGDQTEITFFKPLAAKKSDTPF